MNLFLDHNPMKAEINNKNRTQKSTLGNGKKKSTYISQKRNHDEK